MKQPYDDSRWRFAAHIFSGKFATEMLLKSSNQSTFEWRLINPFQEHEWIIAEIATDIRDAIFR